jgi:hypothetical protein
MALFLEYASFNLVQTKGAKRPVDRLLSVGRSATGPRAGQAHSGACVQVDASRHRRLGPQLVHNNLATYVVGQAGRGRSGNDESRIHEACAAAKANPIADPTTTMPNIGRITDNGSYTAWFGHAFTVRDNDHALTSLHANSSRMGGGPTTPRIPTLHPSPAGYGPAYALPN